MKDEQLAIIKSMETMDLYEAREAALDIVATFTAKTLNQKLRNQQLEKDISVTKKPADVYGIMWRCYLSSEGLRVEGSEWNKHYGS
jgi:hypothetical protein